jgi:hypothetical protein
MQSKAENKQHLLTILRTPVEIEVKESTNLEMRTFSDGSFSKVIELDGSRKEILFDEIDPDEVNTAKFSFASGKWAKLAVIKGSSDKIFDKMVEEEMYPSLIRWEDLSSDYEVLFVGCNSPNPSDIYNVRSWVQAGGTLITSDRSIEMLEDIFSDEMPLSYRDESIASENLRLSFSGNSKSLIGLSGKERLANSYLQVYEKLTEQLPEDENSPVPLSQLSPANSIVPFQLAEFISLENERCLVLEEGCGAPLWQFDYGSGQVIHFTGHFDENIPDLFDEDFFETLVPQRDNDPRDIRFYFGAVEPAVVERQGEFSEMHNAYFVSYIKPYMDLRCSGNPCEFPIGVEGASGKLIVYAPEVRNLVREGMYGDDQIPLADYIVKTYT